MLGDDGVVRPVIRGEVLASNGFVDLLLFLVDTGADLTGTQCRHLGGLVSRLRHKHILVGLAV